MPPTTPPTPPAAPPPDDARTPQPRRVRRRGDDFTLGNLVARVDAVEAWQERADRRFDAVEKHLTNQDRDADKRADQLAEKMDTKLKEIATVMQAKFDGYDALATQYTGASGWTAAAEQRLSLLERTGVDMNTFMTTWKASEQHRRDHMAAQDAKLDALLRNFRDGASLLSKLFVPLVPVALLWIINTAAVPHAAKIDASIAVGALIVLWVLYLAVKIAVHLIGRYLYQGTPPPQP